MTIVTGANTIIKENLLAQEIVRYLDTKFVILPYANTMYEWEIKQQGDTVSIQTFPDLAWSSATTAGATISTTAFAVTKEELKVDQLATFGRKVTNLEEIQSNLNLAGEVAGRMAYSQKAVLESFFVKTVVEGADSDNILGDLSVALTKSNIHEAVEAIRVRLEEENANLDNVKLFVAPKMASLVRQSSLFEWFKEGLDVVRNGQIGTISSMPVIVSNHIGYKCMIGMEDGSAHFVAQRTGFKTTELVDAFASNILGEMAYGWKVCGLDAKRIALYYYSN